MVISDLKFDAFAVRDASPDATPALVEPILLDEQEPDVTLTLPTSSMPSHCPARTPTMALVITMIVKAKAKKFYSKIPSILFLFSVYICFHSLVSIYHIYLAFFIYFARKNKKIYFFLFIKTNNMPILINGPIFFERFVGIITEYFERLLSFIIFGLKS